MKKIITLFILSLFISSSVFAQKTYRKGKEKIRAYKIAHITEELGLTEAEAQKFWPVYNKYDNRIVELRHGEEYKLRKEIKEAGGIDALSDKRAKQIALKMIALEKEEQKITVEFYNKLQKILSYKKIIKLDYAEHNFRRKLLRKYKSHKNKK